MSLVGAFRVAGVEVALDLPAGTLLGLVGDAAVPVLEVLAGLRAPDEGTVELDGAAVDPALVGVALGDHPLVGTLTARENVALRLLALGLPAGADGIDALLAGLRLPPAAAGNLVEQLSGGQQQRVAVARALAGRPALICLDDPTSELDAATGAAVLAVVRAAADAGAIVVVAGDAPPAGADRVLEPR